jgi:putative methionine-R-sulfoxide reductase with GAF domain
MSIENTSAVDPSRTTPKPLVRNDIFLRRSWGNWLLLATTFVITAAGFGLVVGTLLPDHLINPWPWARTDFALVLACVLLVLTLVLYLTREQRNLNRLNAQIQAVRETEEKASRRRLYALLNVSRIMGMHNKPEAVFECITQSCLEAFACDRASLMLYIDATQTLVVRAASDKDGVANVLGVEQSIRDGVAGWAARNKKALILGRERELQEDPDLKLKSPSLVAAMVVPIILRDELVGVINVSSRSPDVQYRDDDLDALQVFAQNAGSFIRHAEQAEWMRQSIESLRRQVARANETAST